jgi:radical SAM superfamily enzyme YgiQ (UPF0313 family)
MRIAIISTFRHPSRLPRKERTVMQPSAPELIAAHCAADAEIEIYNEKEVDVPLDRHWDLVFFSYLDPFYEHTKVLSALFRSRGMTTVAGGRHASLFVDDCAAHFDAVVVGAPEGNVSRLVADFERKRLQRVYREPAPSPGAIAPYRYDLIDLRTNRLRVSTVEASRGCPFSCNFCVLTGRETYRYRPVADVVRDIRAMHWNQSLFGRIGDTFMFYDNNLGGSPRYLRELCEALVPLEKDWGCALTFNLLEDDDLLRLMARAGCRFIYTGLESLNAPSIESMNKRQNRLDHLGRVIRRVYSHGILLSFGLVVGADGDTNEYLARLPEYLAELKFFSITFLGILCPYPGTPLFEQVAREGRLLPGVTARDLDTYTVCHRPKQLHPTEVAEHYRNLCRSIGRLPNVLRHCADKLSLSNRPGYKASMTICSLEVLSIKNNLQNPRRTYIAGEDPIEEWDARMMRELGLAPQRISARLEPAEPLRALG